MGVPPVRWYRKVLSESNYLVLYTNRASLSPTLDLAMAEASQAPVWDNARVYVKTTFTRFIHYPDNCILLVGINRVAVQGKHVYCEHYRKWLNANSAIPHTVFTAVWPG